ncbi:DUF6083 domain-containing protein [Streptomyces sp. NPDC002403]
MGVSGTPRTAEEWTDLQRSTDHEQGLRDGALPGPEPAPDCPDCGLTVDVRPTHYRWWIRLEPPGPAPLLAHTVPPGQRWRLDRDGTAWNAHDREPGAGECCRISHHLVCPRAAPDRAGPAR